jgi:hypothetical protein
MMVILFIHCFPSRVFDYERTRQQGKNTVLTQLNLGLKCQFRYSWIPGLYAFEYRGKPVNHVIDYLQKILENKNFQIVLQSRVSTN